MTGGPPPYRLLVAARARRQLTDALPEVVAAAAWEFASGPMLTDPYRVGKPLVAPLEGTWSARRGTYRLLYHIDEHHRTVTVVDVSHRRDTYRSTT